MGLSDSPSGAISGPKTDLNYYMNYYTDEAHLVGLDRRHVASRRQPCTCQLGFHTWSTRLLILLAYCVLQRGEEIGFRGRLR
jgi:hypothetical protein